ncbi:PAS domain-containing sensor histidine kinase [Paenibacillus sp. MMS18-CY102]|uniref:PAS domain-containing sensor histidine kinase n=1 Tax=Paenibacillus sp. MMS18-CY102 TaxID=2682849 RepID=UPI001365D4CF|nr:PAS domain-containing sensor histidine kinase [Paenibacillus sp. MMS18-CY102]MWC31319.1 PAS domain S-box protein [Paenibacillus sp. MMS18-CY102]
MALAWVMLGFLSIIVFVIIGGLPKRNRRLMLASQRMAGIGNWSYNLERNQLFGTELFFCLIGVPVPPRARMKLESFLELVHPEDRPLIEQHHGVADRKDSFTIGFRIIRPDGKTRWMQAQMQSTSPQRYVGILQDRTEKRNLETEARLAHHHLYSFIDNHMDPIVIWRADGTVLRVNRAFTDLLGYSSEEIEGNGIGDTPFIPDEYREQMNRYCLQTIANKTAATFETERLKKDGGTLQILLSITPLVGADGRMDSWIAILRDCTEQLAATRQLKEAQGELESFIEHNIDAIAFFNRDGTIRKMNAAFERIFGWTLEELKGTPLVDYPFANGRSQDEINVRLREIMSGKGTQNSELQGRHKDGTPLSVMISTTPFPDRNGFAVMFKDVSELKETRDMLGRSEMLSVLGQLAAGVAHEIKNPLTSLKGFARLLEPTLQNKEQRYIGIMKEELDRIELIVNEMLVLSKPQVMEFEERDMSELLNYVIELLGTQAIMKSIEILKGFEEVPPIACEERQLKQVFVNLLKNAIEAMPGNGRGNIHVSIKHAPRPDYIRILVSDQGQGIAPERLARLTEPFYTTKEKGTGLGLMMTASIVERHGGTIQFESELGVGTTVTVTLPVKQGMS